MSVVPNVGTELCILIFMKTSVFYFTFIFPAHNDEYITNTVSIQIHCFCSK